MTSVIYNYTAHGHTHTSILNYKKRITILPKPFLRQDRITVCNSHCTRSFPFCFPKSKSAFQEGRTHVTVLQIDSQSIRAIYAFGWSHTYSFQLLNGEEGRKLVQR